MQKAEKHFTQQQLFSLILPTFYTGFTIVIGRRPLILLKTPWYVLFRLQRTVFLVTYYHVVFDFITKPARKCLIRYFYTDKHICNHECAAWKTIQLKREKNSKQVTWMWLLCHIDDQICILKTQFKVQTNKPDF